MRQTRLIMGMPITIEIADAFAVESDFDPIFSYFRFIDAQFSPFKPNSEVSRMNRGEITEGEYSKEMAEVLRLAEETKRDTDGYFDVWRNGVFNPSGIVKGLAIYKAGKTLDEKGFKNFFIDAGGDMEIRGKNAEGKPWRIGIRNPFEKNNIVKVVELTDCGIATSGTYIRGQHIYNPHTNKNEITDIVSLTVIGKNVYEADRFATAGFAMGEDGISFIGLVPDLEAYMIDAKGVATMTENFELLVPIENTNYVALYR